MGDNKDILVVLVDFGALDLAEHVFQVQRVQKGVETADDPHIVQRGISNVDPGDTLAAHFLEAHVGDYGGTMLTRQVDHPDKNF
ncbi:MAG: hypothetical protein NZM00_09705, partial [Anaerolinea sp.]|nr:hypothetical protein [Anaerolinea sp.]